MVLAASVGARYTAPTLATAPCSGPCIIFSFVAENGGVAPFACACCARCCTAATTPVKLDIVSLCEKQGTRTADRGVSSTPT